METLNFVISAFLPQIINLRVPVTTYCARYLTKIEESARSCTIMHRYRCKTVAV